MLNWANRFSTFCFLDNQDYHSHPKSFECLLGAGVRRKLSASASTAFAALDAFAGEQKSWLFGHLGYDLKNGIETLTSKHTDNTGFPDLFFFEPEVVIRIDSKGMFIEADEPQKIYLEVDHTPVIASSPTVFSGEIHSRLSRENYIATIDKLREHIRRGDCYEINFCQEFFSDDCNINPPAVYNALSTISPNPFSGLYRVDDAWLICASPERFLKKEGHRLLSQPIKGTSPRFPGQDEKDSESRDALFNSSKDRSENVMIVDLVRNDLSRICEEASVKVDELFGIYSFPQVYQMISTVSGILKKGTGFPEIIKATFPMGSMTGAPKKRVMELIEKYEQSRRGIFSGAVGYITPGEDFDFNVVIRSIMYNSSTGYLSFQAGSGITWYSNAESEWEECLVKTAAIRKVLGK